MTSTLRRLTDSPAAVPLFLTLTLALTFAMPAAARAQSDFQSLGLKAGDLVRVVDSSGVETIGTVESPSPNLFTVGRYEFTPENTLRIDKRGDPIWDGVLKGAAFGAAAYAGQTYCSGCGQVVLGWAILGALADAANKGMQPIYTGHPSAPTRITITGDPTWDGLLKGAGAGVVFSLLTDAKDDSDVFVPLTVWSAAVGWAIDAINHNRHSYTINPRRSSPIRVFPLISRTTRGVLLGLSY